MCLTGDQASRRGTLTGGFYDNRKSRLALHSEKLTLAEQIESQERECQQHKKQLENVERKIDEIINEMQKMETKNNKDK